MSTGKDTKRPGEFWIFEPKGDKEVAVILPDKLIDFCSKKLGYYNYVDYNGNYMLVKRERNSIISEAKQEDLKQDIKRYLTVTNKQELVWRKFAASNVITDNFIHLLERIPEAHFNVSKTNEAYFFYHNGVVKIHSGGCQIIPYEDFKGTVWKMQIRNRDFIPVGSEYINAVFSAFLKNVAGNDNSRYSSLISILGYLLHPYKDPSFTKAVILLDENIDFSGAAHGGTGKSLISRAINEIISIVWKDGKKYNPNETFGFDDLRPYHRVLYFDDVKKNFNFEEFYSLITGSLKVNRKYKDSATIPFSLTPKLLISSNYMVKGSGGATDERRRIEFEISPHYSISYTPKDEFGHNLFDEWSTEEWVLFDNLMLRCVSYYINHGVSMPPLINLKENKLKMATDHEFVAFMDGSVELDRKYDKATLLDNFKRLCPFHRNLSSIAFTKWINVWAGARNYTIEHLKSNGHALFIVSLKVE